MVNKFIDEELKSILEKGERRYRIKLSLFLLELLALDWEMRENLREFLFADTIAKYLRDKGKMSFLSF